MLSIVSHLSIHPIRILGLMSPISVRCCRMLNVHCLLCLDSMEDEGTEQLWSDSDESEKKDDKFTKVKWTHEEVSRRGLTEDKSLIQKYSCLLLFRFHFSITYCCCNTCYIYFGYLNLSLLPKLLPSHNDNFCDL